MNVTVVPIAVSCASTLLGSEGFEGGLGAAAFEPALLAVPAGGAVTALGMVTLRAGRGGCERDGSLVGEPVLAQPMTASTHAAAPRW
jgi:hypothetical protein